MSGHAKGPWGFSKELGLVDAAGRPLVGFRLSEVYKDGEFDGNNWSFSMSAEDQALAISAPEMLEALREVEAHHLDANLKAGRDPSRSKTLRIVRAAIAKATGGAR